MEDGFEEWARTRTPSLLRAAYVLTSHQQAAEDLVQCALERVAISWRRIDDQPDAYARKVLYRLGIRRWRRRRAGEFLTAQPPDGSSPDEISALETRVVFQAALQRLTRSQRGVLMLRFYEDLSEAEAAAVLGCSVGAIKSQTHKALQALRKGSPEVAYLAGRKSHSDV
jgi:RNA polymerase sigma-70 factor (sigma-E family)